MVHFFYPTNKSQYNTVHDKTGQDKTEKNKTKQNHTLKLTKSND